jgi:ketosteroid isomerase-like protein
VRADRVDTGFEPERVAARGSATRSQRVELVRAIYEQTGGDLVERFRDERFLADLTAAFGYLAAPSFEFVLVKGMAGPTGVFPGIPGLIKGMREWLASFSSYEVEIERAVEVGASVVLLTIERGRSLRGGVPVEQKGAVVWTFDGESVVKIETYLDRRRALAAFSLPG